MKKNFIRTKNRYISICIILTFLIGYLGQSGMVFAADNDYCLWSYGSVVSNINNVPVAGVPVRVGTTTNNNLNEGDVVSWSVSNVAVAKVETIAGNKFAANIFPLGPGRSDVWCQYKASDSTYSYPTVTIKVPLVVDRNEFKEFLTTNEKAVILSQGEKFDIKLEHGIKYNEQNVKWEVIGRDGVVAVTYNGAGDLATINALKSGYVKVKGTALTDSTIYDEFDVFVEPGVKKAADSSFSDSISIAKEEYVRNYRIETNAVYASDLTWKVYDKEVPGNYSTVAETDLMEINPHSYDQYCDITKAKAGTYYIYIFANGDYMDSSTIKPAKIKVDVGLNVNTSQVLMNVGDSYDILENMNLQEASDVEIKLKDNMGVLSSAVNGVVTALKTGNENVIVKLKNPSKYGFTSANSEWEIPFQVIDGIALNASKVTIPVQGTTTLIPTVTSGLIYDMVWKSSDKNIATVDKDGVVTGVKVGTATVSVYIDINGVTKKASCIVEVTSAVENIVLNPNNLVVGIDKYATIAAKINPSNAVNVNLKWISSDENIVSIVSADNKSALIQGISGGEAIISAINRENVILGSCKVTVSENVKKIVLSDTNIVTDLSNKIIKLTAEVQPESATDKTLTWTSTDTKVATVSDDGIVTLVSSGATTIIVASKSDPTVQALCNITVNVPVTALRFDVTSKVMYTGERYKMSYQVLPANATNKKINWTSLTPGVASIDANGNVTAIAPGQTVIIARTQDGGYLQTCIIYVKQEPTGIILALKDVTVVKGKTYQIEYTLQPETATEKTILWESNNTSIATVDNDGKITAVEAGSAIIMARTALGETAYCNVTVVEEIESLELNYTAKTVTKGKTFKLKAMIKPEGATDRTVVWTSSNNSVATVSASGVVKGIKGGVAIIYCKTRAGDFTASCLVTVKELATSIKLNKTSYKLGVGNTVTLKATVTTTSSTNKTVKWRSTNTSVATVSSTGRVTGKKLGTCKIIATAQDGSKVTASCNIRVVIPVKSLKLNKTAMTIVQGRSSKLTATISPQNATYKTGTFTTEDESIAMVSSTGVVTGIKPGAVWIKVTAKDNSGKTAKCYVRVIEEIPATSITLPQKTLVMASGDIKLLEKTVQPANYTDKITWSSDNTRVVSVNKSTGKITAKNTGVANITAMTTSGKTATVTVTVVGLNRTAITIQQYTTYALNVDQINSGIKWYVENPSIASVDNGIVTGYKPGASTYVFANVNGCLLRCRVTVTRIS